MFLVVVPRGLGGDRRDVERASGEFRPVAFVYVALHTWSCSLSLH